MEGANLFITQVRAASARDTARHGTARHGAGQDARIVLENAGVILFKDASANKGGQCPRVPGAPLAHRVAGVPLLCRCDLVQSRGAGRSGPA